MAWHVTATHRATPGEPASDASLSTASPFCTACFTAPVVPETFTGAKRMAANCAALRRAVSCTSGSANSCQSSSYLCERKTTIPVVLAIGADPGDAATEPGADSRGVAQRDSFLGGAM